jgi:hypothetical protein
MNIQKKEYDWIRIAFLLDKLGPSTADQIAFYFGKIWTDRIRSARSIANTLYGKQRHGFESRNGHPKTYNFNGDLPKIGKYTYTRWNKKLTPLKGGSEKN